MPYIHTDNDYPGIRGLMEFRPDAANALNALAETLLVSPSPLSRGERELIASFVSSCNQCTFCMTSHGAIATCLPGIDETLLQEVWKDYTTSTLSAKMKALLSLAKKVALGGRHVEESDIILAREAGAGEIEIHDTVLIAAAFCMFNRYVDGLGATVPDDPGVYEIIGKQRAAEGYLTKSVLVK